MNAPLLLHNRLFLSIGPKLSFYDKDYARAYFGVTPQQSARSGYAMFAPGSGYQASVDAAAAYLLTPRLSLSTFASYGHLFGDIDRSQIVRSRFVSRDQFTGGANLTYRFNLGG